MTTATTSADSGAGVGVARGVVIVGSGQAGVETAGALRLGGFDGAITMVGEEVGLPYARPPLSKAFLAGKIDETQLQLRTDQQLAEQRIDLISGRRAVAIEREERLVLLDDGTRLPYDRLVLATGGDPRVLPDRFGAARAGNVLTLRTVGDARSLRERLRPGVRVAIVGGGYVGLEIAAAARTAGATVTVLEAAPRVLARVTSPVMSEFFQRVHAEEGVEVIVDARLAGFEVDVDGEAQEVRLEDGRRIPVDFVLVGIGLVPRTELAESAGLAVDNGIVVDEGLRTSDPRIFAVGDVARHPDPQHGGLRRLESAPNASEQARTAAGSILGTERPYDALPWFWSDQYDVKLQVAGVAQGYDSIVVRGDAMTGRRVTVLYLRDDVLVAADVVNKPADFAFCKRLIAQATPVDPERLADPEVPLKEGLAKTAPA